MTTHGTDMTRHGPVTRTPPIRVFLVVEAASLAVAAMVHAGLLVPGPFDQATIYEATIAAVLVVGLAIIHVRPAWTRATSLMTQGFALLGAMVGFILVIRGVGPDSTADIVYHLALIVVLAWGLVVAWRLGRR